MCCQSTNVRLPNSVLPDTDKFLWTQRTCKFVVYVPTGQCDVINLRRVVDTGRGRYTAEKRS